MSLVWGDVSSAPCFSFFFVAGLTTDIPLHFKFLRKFETSSICVKNALLLRDLAQLNALRRAGNRSSYRGSYAGTRADTTIVLYCAESMVVSAFDGKAHPIGDSGRRHINPCA